MSVKMRGNLVGAYILIAYLMLISLVTDSKVLVLGADFISGGAVIGIAVLMYPLFRDSNEELAKFYLCTKCIEGFLMFTAGVFFAMDRTQYLRDEIYFSVHTYIFIVSAFVFYILLYQSQLIPRFISVWGLLGILTLRLSTILQYMDIDLAVINGLLVLIITNEIFLALWLFV